MPINKFQALIAFGDVEVLKRLRERGIIPDFVPSDWLQMSLTSNNDMIAYLCSQIYDPKCKWDPTAGRFPDVTTSDKEKIRTLIDNGYPPGQLVSAALASKNMSNITAVLSVVKIITDTKMMHQIIDNAGQTNIGDLLLSFVDMFPEEIEGIVCKLIRNGNDRSLIAIKSNEGVAAAIRATSTETIRSLVESGSCATVKVILDA